ncbi:UNVERIFIED_CONTAM: hypothetical protein Sangu_2734300 [Sesamum angustifolium]|uniref:Uncharacterized protein n=1 Tax=Sesamum angustifolium TaxID=2727405 RepID=A0AAW2IW78_9LAMI
MNGIEKSLHDLMVQNEATIEKSTPSIPVGQASTSKANGKIAGRDKRKKDETSSTAASTSSALVTPIGRGK